MQTLGAATTAFHVGLGLVCFVVACLALYSRVHHAAGHLRGLARFAFGLARFVYGLLVAAVVSATWLYLLLERKISIVEFVFLGFGIAVALLFLHRARLLPGRKPAATVGGETHA
jgi:hypothetical protein